MKTANSFKNKRSKNTAEKAFHSACPCMQNQKAFPKKYYPYLYFVENAFIVKRSDKKKSITIHKKKRINKNLR